MKNGPDKLAQVAELVANDGWALTFQTFGQYRAALLKEVRRLQKQPERLVYVPESWCLSCCFVRPVTSAGGGAL